MKEVVAWVFGAGMFLNAGIFVPQALHLWRARRAEGVSLLTFAGFNVLQITGTLQGYFQHDLALMMGMAASLLTCGAVTCLAARYQTPRGTVDCRYHRKEIAEHPEECDRGEPGVGTG